MADISSITIPSGESYNLKDSIARKNVFYYGECSTAASTQAKVVTIDGITEYYTGLSVRILFTKVSNSFNKQISLLLLTYKYKSIETSLPRLYFL